MRRYVEVTEQPDGSWHGERQLSDGGRAMAFTATPSLIVIEWAYYGGCAEIEALADGYGAGAGTHGDWSGVRDSSDEARAAMLAAALNWVEAQLTGSDAS